VIFDDAVCCAGTFTPLRRHAKAFAHLSKGVGSVFYGIFNLPVGTLLSAFD